jgi:hypothetical protein
MKYENTPHYGMFSDGGNAAVHEVVEIARLHKIPWKQVQRMLNDLSEIEIYSEASDTAVREEVYAALSGRLNNAS